MTASSANLHPQHGARFVLEREGEAPRYGVEVYLPQGRRASGTLAWDAEGRSEVHFEVAPEADDAWIVEGVEKLARVLKRDPKSRLIRWREAP